jgi:Tfp pilus assembly protein PilO
MSDIYERIKGIVPTALVICALGLGGITGYSLVAPGLAEQEALTSEFDTLLETYRNKHAKALTLDQLKERLHEFEPAASRILAGRLPDRFDENAINGLVPELLSSGNLRAGMWARRERNQRADFYESTFIDLQASGSYRDVLAFSNAVARRRELATLEALKIVRRGNEIDLEARLGIPRRLTEEDYASEPKRRR